MPLQRKGTIFFIVLSVIIFIGVGILFWGKYLPLQEQITTLKESIETEEQIVEALEGKEPEFDSGELLQKATSLQEKLPVEALVDQFILDLEVAEISSKSKITGYTFSEGEEIEEGEEGTDEETEGTAENDSEQGEENEEAAEGEEETPLPEGIKRLAIDLSVESPSFLSLKQFIEKIEEMPRITSIDQLSFDGFSESEEEVEKEMLVYSVSLSTFYYPQYEELIHYLPKYEQPEPAEKKDPLYPIGGINPSDNHVEQTTLPKRVEKDGQTYNVYTYHVNKGDTLYGISMQYFNSRKGEQLIRDWNGIGILYAGTTIEIPVLVEKNADN